MSGVRRVRGARLPLAGSVPTIALAAAGSSIAAIVSSQRAVPSMTSADRLRRRRRRTGADRRPRRRPATCGRPSRRERRADLVVASESGPRSSDPDRTSRVAARRSSVDRPEDRFARRRPARSSRSRASRSPAWAARAVAPDLELPPDDRQADHRPRLVAVDGQLDDRARGGERAAGADGGRPGLERGAARRARSRAYVRIAPTGTSADILSVPPRTGSR